MKLFTKEFLDKLENHYEPHNVLKYLMEDCDCNFHDAILYMAKCAKIKPEYFKE